MRATLLPRAAGSLAAVLIGLLPAACATTRYTQSRVVALPPEVKGRPGSTASLEVEGLRLRVEALDRAPQEKALPPLALRLVFDPPELGYSFDPGQVVLRRADGEEWRTPGDRYLPLYPKARFDLEFGAVIQPESSYELVLGGLAHGRRPLAPVTLRLARRSGRSIDRLYWAEPLGYLVGLGW